MKICSIFLLFLIFTDPSTYPSYRVYSGIPKPLPTSKGELIYQEAQCALCHEELGEGEGILANGLEPRPRDFTSLEQMIRVPDMGETAREVTIRSGAEPMWILSLCLSLNESGPRIDKYYSYSCCCKCKEAAGNGGPSLWFRGRICGIYKKDLTSAKKGVFNAKIIGRPVYIISRVSGGATTHRGGENEKTNL